MFNAVERLQDKLIPVMPVIAPINRRSQKQGVSGFKPQV